LPKKFSQFFKEFSIFSKRSSNFSHKIFSSSPLSFSNCLIFVEKSRFCRKNKNFVESETRTLLS
jgi:hypothetical protein